MKILRKPTISSEITQYHSHNSNPIKSHHKNLSQLQSISSIGSQLQQSQTELDLSFPSDDGGQSRVKTNSSSKGLMQKIIDGNSFTINILNKMEKNQAVTEIQSIAKAQKMLIRPSAFSNFQEMNQQNGCYRQELQSLQKKEDNHIMRFNLGKQFKIKTRKNIYEVERVGKNYSQRKRGSIIQSQINKNISRISQNLSFIHKKKQKAKLSQLRNTKFFKGSKEGWSLSDFFDPLISELDVDSPKQQIMKERLVILQKLKNINDQCLQIERDGKTAKSVGIFSKYCEQMGSKLKKKKNKLEKVNLVFA